MSSCNVCVMRSHWQWRVADGVICLYSQVCIGYRNAIQRIINCLCSGRVYLCILNFNCFKSFIIIELLSEVFLCCYTFNKRHPNLSHTLINHPRTYCLFAIIFNCVCVVCLMINSNFITETNFKKAKQSTSLDAGHMSCMNCAI